LLRSLGAGFLVTAFPHIGYYGRRYAGFKETTALRYCVSKGQLWKSSGTSGLSRPARLYKVKVSSDFRPEGA
jgi:hypothetical protein